MTVVLHHVEDVMGTAVTIDIADPGSAAGKVTGAVERVCAWLHEVDRRFSTYKPDSEVNRLDRGVLPRQAWSADLRHVVDACADLWRETDGFFDAYATGRFDPSGYVKGWSVDVASERLAAAGLTNHCVNAGGDVRTMGRPEPGQEWRIGIRHPWQTDKLCWVVAGTDIAVATSGSYERGFHVVNPRTGEPAREARSVTVVGPDLGRSDGYATAALAMGEAGLDWLAKLTTTGYESAVVMQDGTAFSSAGLPVAPFEDPAGGLTKS